MPTLYEVPEAVGPPACVLNCREESREILERLEGLGGRREGCHEGVMSLMVGCLPLRARDLMGT